MLVHRASQAGLYYVDVDQPEPSFHKDSPGSWWIVSFGPAIKRIDGPPVGNWGRVDLRFEHSGAVCRVNDVHQTGKGMRDGHQNYTACLFGTQRKL